MNASASVIGAWRHLGPSSERILYSALVAVLVVVAGLALALLPLSWAAYVTAAAGVLLLILIRPVIGLYLLVVAIPFGSLKEISFGVIVVGGAEALAALPLAAWLVRMLAR